MSELIELYRKKLCMSELWVGHGVIPRCHYYEESDGETWAVFLLPVKGKAAIRTSGRTLRLEPDELAFLPEGIQYEALWTGDPDIEFYTFRIVSRQFDTQNIERFAVQKLPADSETVETIREIARLFANGSRIDRVRAIGLYYGFYAHVLPFLSPDEPIRYHPAVVSALSYLDEHYKEDFEIEELAKVACVSQSRLFHLFREQLDTTPIRYRNELRVIRASRALRLTDQPIDSIADLCGFHSPVYFREIFKEITGLTPSEYRRTAGSPD